IAGSAIFDLARREADVAVRFFRTQHEHLVAQKAGVERYALYGSRAYLDARGTPNKPENVRDHALMSTGESAAPSAAEWHFIQKLAPKARHVFTTNLTVALMNAVIAGAGLAVLP